MEAVFLAGSAPEPPEWSRGLFQAVRPVLLCRVLGLAGLPLYYPWICRPIGWRAAEGYAGRTLCLCCAFQWLCRNACPLRPRALLALVQRVRASGSRATSFRLAGVAELVDALVLGTSIARCGGSSPFARTNPSPGAGADHF